MSAQGPLVFWFGTKGFGAKGLGPGLDKNLISALTYVFSNIVHSLLTSPPHTARHALLGYYPGENVTAAKLQKSTSDKSASKSCVRSKLHNWMVLNLDNVIYFEGSSNLAFLMWGHRS